MSILAIALVVVGGSISVASALLVVGAFAPRLRYLGVYGSMIWPTFIGPATLVVSLGVALGALAYTIDQSVVALAVVAVGVFALVGTLVILGDQVLVAVRVGVPVRLRLFIAARPGPKAMPDDTASYGADPDGEPLAILVYRPPNTTTDVTSEGAPIVVYVHGGGWYQGEPDESPGLQRWFADQGYVVFAPSYTLATEQRPTWDLAMPQIARALTWVADHACEFGGDPSRIAVWGGSAGANLTLTATYAAAGGKLPTELAERFPRIAAVAGEVPAVDPSWIAHNPDPMWGPRTREMVERYIGGTTEEHSDRLAAIRVETNLTADAPPTLLSISDGDHLVPVDGVRQFVEAARSAGVDVRAVHRRWGDHLLAAIPDGLPSQTLARRLLDHFRSHGV